MNTYGTASHFVNSPFTKAPDYTPIKSSKRQLQQYLVSNIPLFPKDERINPVVVEPKSPQAERLQSATLTAPSEMPLLSPQRERTVTTAEKTSEPLSTLDFEQFDQENKEFVEKTAEQAEQLKKIKEKVKELLTEPSSRYKSAAFIKREQELALLCGLPNPLPAATATKELAQLDPPKLPEMSYGSSLLSLLTTGLTIEDYKKHHQECEKYYSKLDSIKGQFALLQPKLYDLRGVTKTNEYSVPSTFEALTGKKFASDSSEQQRKTQSEDELKLSKAWVDKGASYLLNEAQKLPEGLSDHYHALLGKAQALHTVLVALFKEGEMWLRVTQVLKQDDFEKMGPHSGRSPEEIAELLKERDAFIQLREKCYNQYDNITLRWKELELVIKNPDMLFDINKCWQACIDGWNSATYSNKTLTVWFYPPPKHVLEWTLEAPRLNNIC